MSYYPQPYGDMIVIRDKYTFKKLMNDLNKLDKFNEELQKIYKSKVTMKQPAFTLNALTITETKTGITGTVVKDKNGYEVKLGEHNLTDAKANGLASRMKKWYYYNHVQKK